MYFHSRLKRKVKCAVCGKLFVTNHPSKKTCSDECSMINKENQKKILCEDNKRYYRNIRKAK